MAIIDQLAVSLGRKDDEPNKVLAKEIVAKKNIAGVKELAGNLQNADAKIVSNCLEVLEWVSTEKPELVSDYASQLLSLVQSKNNRHVWSAMIVLARIADLAADVIWKSIEEIIRVTETGSVITMDNGIKIMAQVSSQNETYEKKLFPILMKYLKECRSKSIPQYSESVFVAVNQDNKNDFVRVLQNRMEQLSSSQKNRVQKVIKKVELL